ncbi:MAG: hypothetical protein RSA15_04425, partial [Bacilli bacterium]
KMKDKNYTEKKYYFDKIRDGHETVMTNEAGEIIEKNIELEKIILSTKEKEELKKLLTLEFRARYLIIIIYVLFLLVIYYLYFKNISANPNLKDVLSYSIVILLFTVALSLIIYDKLKFRKFNKLYGLRGKVKSKRDNYFEGQHNGKVTYYVTVSINDYNIDKIITKINYENIKENDNVTMVFCTNNLNLESKIIKRE